MTRGVGIAKRGFGKALSRTGYSGGGSALGEAKAGEVFTKETEYKKGGRVKKNKGGLIRGIPKLAMRGY